MTRRVRLGTPCFRNTGDCLPFGAKKAAVLAGRGKFRKHPQRTGGMV